MKLLHVTATHLSPVGGIPVVLKDLTDAQNLIDDFEARVLSVVADVSLMNSSNFYFLGNRSFSDFLDDFQPDIVIFHSHYYFKYLKLYPYCVKRNIPYFIEPHGSFVKESLKKSRWKKIIANHFVFRRFMKKAKGFIFLNKAESLNSRFRTLNDIIIPNGICISKFNEAFCESGEKDVSLYYIGRYDINHKGLDCLFDAFDILEGKGRTVNVEFWGKGSSEAEAYLKRRCRNYKHIQVKFNSPIYGQEQERTLNHKGIMVLTSRYEGFPMTILEAWKYGNPCIVSDGTNVAEEVVENELGWRTKLDPASIADTIEIALREYQEKKEMFMHKCKMHVQEKYTWPAIAQHSFTELVKYRAE